MKQSGEVPLHTGECVAGMDERHSVTGVDRTHGELYKNCLGHPCTALVRNSPALLSLDTYN